MMSIKLIEGEFSQQDAIDIITQMIHVKIKYHEGKIANSLLEEDVKFREKKIKYLQKILYDFKNNLDFNSKNINIESIINLH